MDLSKTEYHEEGDDGGGGNDELTNITKCDIFTPDDMSTIMSSRLSHRGKLLEPCVGTGNLLKHINVENYERIDVYEI